MADTHTHLCIGGPLDGQRYEPSDSERYGKRRFHLKRLKPIETRGVHGGRSDESQIVTAEIEECVYLTMDFHSPSGVVLFWAEEKLTPVDTLLKLAERYTKKDDET